MIDLAKQFTLVRDLDASPEQVWSAWLVPSRMTAWLHPEGFSTPIDTIAVDPQVGGSYVYTMVDDATGEEYVTAGTFLEMEEPRRLVMTWGTPGELDDAPRITVELDDVEGRTRMTFTLQGIAGQPGDDDVYDGWDQALRALQSVQP